jgi:hypothetical protein
MINDKECNAKLDIFVYDAMHDANMCIKQYFVFNFFNNCKIQLVKLECVIWQIFF